jgi:hypothetical protein
VLGNHDVFPEDLYPAEAEAFYHAYLTWDKFFFLLSQKWWSNGNFNSFLNRDGGWNELLDKQAQESFGKCGFYSLNVTPELKVLEICFFLLIFSVFRKFSLLGCHPEHKLVQWTQQFDSQPRRSLWAAEMVWTSTWGSSIKEVQSTLI